MGDITTVAQTIQRVEGYFPGSLSYRNNNPGNLRPAGQPGCTPADGFCSFPSYDAGYQALINQINLDASRGLSISQFINKYAPATDANDPASYAATIAQATGLSVNDPLSSALGALAIPGTAAVPPDTTTTDAGVFSLADAGSSVSDVLASDYSSIISSGDGSTALWIAGGIGLVVLLAAVL